MGSARSRCCHQQSQASGVGWWGQRLWLGEPQGKAPRSPWGCDTVAVAEGGTRRCPLLQPGSPQARGRGAGAAPGRAFVTVPAVLPLEPSQRPAKLLPSALDHQPAVAPRLVPTQLRARLAAGRSSPGPRTQQNLPLVPNPRSSPGARQRPHPTRAQQGPAELRIASWPMPLPAEAGSEGLVCFWTCERPLTLHGNAPSLLLRPSKAPRRDPVPTAQPLSTPSAGTAQEPCRNRAGTAQEPRTPQPCRGFLPLCEELTAKPRIILKHTQAYAGVPAAAAEQHREGEQPQSPGSGCHQPGGPP